MPPYFSIIIPMFNREKFITRTINSCLKQDFENFEIIIVDDSSTDGSVDVAKGYSDYRIKLICHDVNRGVGPARNSGVDSATGQWVICLDSDDELLPGSLSIILRRSREVDESISRLQFMVQMDTGELSPCPPLRNEFWDYIKYIRWVESCCGHPSETLPVVRRSTFKKIRYYDDRTLEGPYHFDFMKQFTAWSFPDVVRLYHCDAENQLTRPSIKCMIESAQNQLISGELLLKNHGEALKIYAPQVYRRQLSGLATLCFLSGRRFKGIHYSLTSLSSDFLFPRSCAILLCGIMGPKPLAFLKSFRTRLS